jgi:hypothetical protein
MKKRKRYQPRPDRMNNRFFRRFMKFRNMPVWNWHYSAPTTNPFPSVLSAIRESYQFVTIVPGEGKVRQVEVTYLPRVA